MAVARRLDSPSELLRIATPFLARHEVENGLILGVAAEMAMGPAPAPAAFWAVAMDGDDVVAAAVRTGGKLLLARSDAPAAAAELAEEALRDGATRVLGPAREVRALAERSTKLRGVSWREGSRQRIYELRRVIPPRPAPGDWRVAREGDRDTILRWMAAFSEEAMRLREDTREMTARVAPRVARGEFYLWRVNGEDVSMTGGFGPTPHGIRVGAVYTPPAQRGKGYASALVAAVSRKLLDDGLDFTFLYTDLSNPTSNAIYQRIGYVPVADPLELEMELSEAR